MKKQTKKLNKMERFKGTRGDWSVGSNLSIYSKRFPAGIDAIAKIKAQFHAEQTKANAQLISKALEMLELLIFLRGAWGTSTASVEKIDKLIKEATEI